MAETEGLWHFYMEDSNDDAGVPMHRAYQVDDEDAALIQEGEMPFLGDAGLWMTTPEEAIITLLEMQLEACDGNVS